jgi:hypothetical protein
MTLTRYLAHLPRWGVEVAVALEDGTQSDSGQQVVKTTRMTRNGPRPRVVQYGQ